MTDTSFETRARRAFEATPERSYADTYLDTVTQNWRESLHRMRTTLVLLLLAMATFELLNEAKVTELSLGPAKLTDATPILQAIPALVSFFIYEIVYMLELSVRYTRVHRAVLKTVYPRVETEDLDYALAPPAPTLWGVDSWLGSGQGKAAQAWMRSSFVLPILILGAGFAFQFYAFWSLLAGPNDLLIWVSLMFSVLMSTRAGLVLYLPLD